MEWSKANTIDQINGGPLLFQFVGSAILTANAGALGTRGAAASISYRIRSDDFLWTHAFAFSTGTFRHRIYADWEGRNYDNDFIRSDLFWGSTIGKAFPIPPKFLPIDSQLTFSLEDTSTATNTVELYLIGMKAPTCGEPDASKLKCQNPKCQCPRTRFGMGRGLYVMSTPSLTGVVAAASSSGDGTILNEDYTHSRVIYCHAASRIGGDTGNTKWEGYFETKDPRDCERTYFANETLRGAVWTGNAANPCRFPSPLLVERGSEIGIQIQDTGGAGSTVDFNLISERVDDDIVVANA